MKPVPALLPFSWLYGCGVVLRNLFYDWQLFHIDHVDVPVISVGNISTGGTGKTPVAGMIAKMLQGKNIRSAIVSRGYKRETRGLVEVSDGFVLKATARESGDEAFQLATSLVKTIVVVDDQRLRGARYAVSKLNAQAVVLDDGFQHRSLHRDLDIVLIDAAYSPFTMPMLPAGYRRDSLRSLKRANAVLLTKVKPTLNVERLKEQIRRYSHARIFSSSFTVTAFRRAKTGFSVNLSSVKGKHAVAFCGIGQPESFRESLQDIGIIVSSMITFDDHHSYSDSDVRNIVAEQEKLKAEYIITTEKDMARLSSFEFSETYPLFCLEIEVTVREEKEWTSLINSVFDKTND
ncbi:MAG: tetraacyldisaccharide 4'-kinase [Bacteroidota bacterium]